MTLVFKMASLIVELHDTVKDHINKAENRDLATKIGNEVLQLTWAVVKKHTLGELTGFKYHLAQPARMLSRAVVLWNKAVICRMHRKPCFIRPWTINLSWNVPKEVFECLKIVLLLEEYGGIHKKNTPAVEEIQVDDIFQLHCAFFMLANKYERKLNEGQFLWKVEKDSSYSKFVVSAAHPAMFKFSKNLEIMRFTARYGHFNRHGVPQLTLA